jgi:hypothetical protein
MSKADEMLVELSFLQALRTNFKAEIGHLRNSSQVLGLESEGSYSYSSFTDDLPARSVEAVSVNMDTTRCSGKNVGSELARCGH